MTWPSFLILLEIFLAFFFVYSFHAFLVSQRKMGTTLKQLAYVIWNPWLFRMKCYPYVNLLSRESHERFAFITVKQFQVYFRLLQKPSCKWIQSISPRRVTFTWKPSKICFYQSDFKFIFARFRNRAASEYNQFRRLASVLRTSMPKLLSRESHERFAFINAISSSFSLASETEPQVNTINFTASRQFCEQAR